MLITGNEYYVRIIEITRTSDNLVNNDSSDDKNDSNSNKNDSTNDKNDSSSDKSDSVSNKSDSSSNKSDSTDNKSDSKNNNSSNKSDSGSKGDYKEQQFIRRRDQILFLKSTLIRQRLVYIK